MRKILPASTWSNDHRDSIFHSTKTIQNWRRNSENSGGKKTLRRKNRKIEEKDKPSYEESTRGRSLMPCDVCLELDRFTGDRWKCEIKADLTSEYSLAFMSSQLIKSAGSGCTMCSIVLKGLELMSRNLSLFDVESFAVGRFILLSGSSLEVEVLDKVDEESSTNAARIQFYTHPGDDSDAKPFSAARDIAPACSADWCSRIIKEWIAECLKHEACAAVIRPANELPCRLLDLKHRDAASVVLVDTKSHAACQYERYATLSHCWGEVQLIQTSSHNLALRLQGIEWDHLPKTFQDTITIVRSLGIRFLWIDSLCIVQNDPLEWATESVRMAAIYSNSYINIAATGAPDSRWGCFTRRTMKHTTPNSHIQSFPVHEESSNFPTVFVRPSLERVHQRYSTCCSQEFDPPDSVIAPLLSRAWVFQERQLAPRTLHFHPSELVMECRTCLRCECSGLDNVVPWSRRRSVQKSCASELLTSWLDVVEEYSKLSLKYHSDRILALTGVATVFQQKLRSQYLAGIWQEDVARGLLWDVTRSQCSPSNRSIGRHEFAPTWSWASMILDVEGSGVVFPTSHDDTFQVDARFAFHKTSLPFTATDINTIVPGTASLSLRAAVVLATAHTCIKFHDGHVHADLVLVFEQDIEDMVMISTTQMKTDCTLGALDSLSSEPGTSVHCLLVGVKVSFSREFGQRMPYYCALVLKPCASNAQLKERIGVLSLPRHLQVFEHAVEDVFDLI